MSYSYSFNEESYTGQFDTREGAIKEAMATIDEGRTAFWTGSNREPEFDLRALDGDLIIEGLQDSEDDLMIEQADGWPNATSAQVDDLTATLRAAFNQWVSRHELEPKFWLVENVQEHQVGAKAL